MVGYAFAKFMQERAEPKVYQDPIEPLLLTELVEKAVQADAQKWQGERRRQSEGAKEILQRIYGSDVESPTYLSPAVASMCIRWAAYADSSNVEPLPATFKQNMDMIIGTSVHWTLLKKLSPFGMQELSLRKDEPFVSGRLDFLFRNPQTKKWQVLDFKVVGDYTFQAVKRDGLSDFLRANKKVYKAKPEAELQVLLYMWIAKEHGYDVDAGNVIYINKRDGDFKECVILWDAVAEEKTKGFLHLLQEAQQLVSRGKLPAPSVARGSEYLCKNICSFRHVCEPGRDIVGGKVDLTKKKPVSRQARFFAKKSAEDRKRKMEESGRMQPRLFED